MFSCVFHSFTSKGTTFIQYLTTVNHFGSSGAAPIPSSVPGSVPGGVNTGVNTGEEGRKENTGEEGRKE